MKNLFISIVVCLVLFSCKKEPKDLSGQFEDENSRKYNITFDLKDFSPQILGVKGYQTSETPLSKKIAYLVYIAYDEEGTEVSRVRQDSTGATIVYRSEEEVPNDTYVGKLTFGTFNDTLAAGNYTIVMIASQAEIGINSYNEQEAQPFDALNSAYFIYEYRFMENRSRTKDTFYKKFQLKVEGKDLQQKVELERIVGKAEINILDSKPNLAYRFQFIHEREGINFLNDGLFGETEDESFFGASGVIREKTKFTAYILNTDPDRPIDIVIEARENGVLVKTKTIEKVPFFKNKRTILTGNMHSSESAAGFNIKVNDEFDKDTVNISF